MALLELCLIKDHLRIELEDTSEDLHLEQLGAAASRACEVRIGRWVDPGDAPEDSAAAPLSEADLMVMRQAALILVGEWHANRESSAVTSGITELPLSVTWLLDSLRDFSDR